VSGLGGYTCRRCGEWHDDLPLAYHFVAPAWWSSELESDSESELAEDACVIRGEHFFIRGLLWLPVLGSEQDFAWGIWVSLSEASFVRAGELWDREGREAEPPMFGWLSSELPVYEPSTLLLKTRLHTQPVGIRPRLELEPTDHQLAVEQRAGIRMERVQEFAEQLRHDRHD
jgi:hypothetical protein